MMQFISNQLRSVIQEREFQGRPYLVAPVIAITGDAVLNGEFVPLAELQAGLFSWNGRPVTLGHPQIDGEFVSANDPQLLERYQVGHLFNALIEDGKIKGELWVDIAAARGSADGQELLSRLRRGDPVEVSTGYGRRLETHAGSLNGQRYDGIARDLKPDHLAVLLNDIGACSWADGCGTPRVNQQRSACMNVNLLTQARTPTYSSTTSAEWVRTNLEDYGFDAAAISDLTEAQRAQIAEGSLLGDPAAETYAELSFFPVVTPGGALNENALRAVISGRGAQADIPAETLRSAQSVARRLLEEEFDMEPQTDNVEVNILRRVFRALGIRVHTDALDAVHSENEIKPMEDESMNGQELMALGEQYGISFTAEEVGMLPLSMAEKLGAFIESVASSDMETEGRSEPATNCQKLTAIVEQVGGVDAASALLTNVYRERQEHRAAQIAQLTANTDLEAAELEALPDATLTKLVANLSGAPAPEPRKPDYSGRAAKAAEAPKTITRARFDMRTGKPITEEVK